MKGIPKHKLLVGGLGYAPFGVCWKVLRKLALNIFPYEIGDHLNPPKLILVDPAIELQSERLAPLWIILLALGNSSFYRLIDVGALEIPWLISVVFTFQSGYIYFMGCQPSTVIRP